MLTEKKFIEIQEKEKCCGCGACANACKQRCISMEFDEEGFLYPHVNTDLCVNCGLCVEKCHMKTLIQNKNVHEPQCYAAYNKNDEQLKEGSSGGLFELLCEVMYGWDGVVYGASLEDRFHVRHRRAINLEEAKKFRKSKYLQSDIGCSFQMVEKDLEDGRKVLFSGTPCQIEGLYSYLGNDYSNLYTIDLVCHGVPSRAVFISYLEALEEKYSNRPISICWRDKRDGWGPNKLSIKFKDGQELLTQSSNNAMQLGFLRNFYLRPSCFKCRYATIPRIADISLGDFWGYDGDLSEENKNKGLSMVVISNKKGKEFFDRIKEKIISEKVDIEYCKNKSIHLSNSPIWNENRPKFMRDFTRGMKFKDLYLKYIGTDCEVFGLEDLIKQPKNNSWAEYKFEGYTGKTGEVVWKKASN